MHLWQLRSLSFHGRCHAHASMFRCLGYCACATGSFVSLAGRKQCTRLQAAEASWQTTCDCRNSHVLESSSASALGINMIFQRC